MLPLITTCLTISFSLNLPASRGLHFLLLLFCFLHFHSFERTNKPDFPTCHMAAIDAYITVFISYHVHICACVVSQREVRFWFATGGAGFCLSRRLAERMAPWARYLLYIKNCSVLSHIIFSTLPNASHIRSERLKCRFESHQSL